MERYYLHYTENRPGCQMLKRSGKKSEKGVDNGAAVCYYNLALREQSQYRGVEQLVARRAHNPEVVRFKSHPRNQRKEHHPTDGVLFFEYGGTCTARMTGYEPDRRITRRVRR